MRGTGSLSSCLSVHAKQCPCSTGSQTIEHLLQTCPLFELLRKGMWPNHTPLTSKLFGSLEDLQHSVTCIEKTGISMSCLKRRRSFPVHVYFLEFMNAACLLSEAYVHQKYSHLSNTCIHRGMCVQVHLHVCTLTHTFILKHMCCQWHQLKDGSQVQINSNWF